MAGQSWWIWFLWREMPNRIAFCRWPDCKQWVEIGPIATVDALPDVCPHCHREKRWTFTPPPMVRVESGELNWMDRRLLKCLHISGWDGTLPPLDPGNPDE